MLAAPRPTKTKTRACTASPFTAKPQGPSGERLKENGEKRGFKKINNHPKLHKTEFKIGGSISRSHAAPCTMRAFCLLSLGLVGGGFDSSVSRACLLRTSRTCFKALTRLARERFTAGAFRSDAVCSLHKGTCGGDVFSKRFPSSTPSLCSERQLLISLINTLFSQRQACCCLYNFLENRPWFKSLVLRRGRAFAAVSPRRESPLS